MSLVFQTKKDTIYVDDVNRIQRDRATEASSDLAAQFFCHCKFEVDTGILADISSNGLRLRRRRFRGSHPRSRGLFNYSM